VPERDAHEEQAAEGLPRLPPGRHGLGRDFVVKNQRDRLTAGSIAVIAERGYHEATVSQICSAAGVSRRTFYSYFSSKQECYLATFGLIDQHLLDAMREAAAGVSGWPAQVGTRLGAMLDVFAANPDLARFMLIAPPRAGEEVAAAYRASLERFAELLTQGQPSASRARQPSAAVKQALVGGMMGVIAHRVEAGEGENLADLLPDLVELFLTPFIGPEKALSAADLAG